MEEIAWPNFSKNLISGVKKIINSGNINYTTGPYGRKFEKKFSEFVGNKYSIAICNGTRFAMHTKVSFFLTIKFLYIKSI